MPRHGFVKKGHHCAKGFKKKKIRIKGHGTREMCVKK